MRWVTVSRSDSIVTETKSRELRSTILTRSSDTKIIPFKIDNIHKKKKPARGCIANRTWRFFFFLGGEGKKQKSKKSRSDNAFSASVSSRRPCRRKTRRRLPGPRALVQAVINIPGPTDRCRVLLIIKHFPEPFGFRVPTALPGNLCWFADGGGGASSGNLNNIPQHGPAANPVPYYCFVQTLRAVECRGVRVKPRLTCILLPFQFPPICSRVPHLHDRIDVLYM